MSEIEIIVIDDNLSEDSPLMITLQMEYSIVKLFKNSNDGLEYILRNLIKKMIIILDINFPSNEYNGHRVLAEIREQNKLIPVIIWSAKDGSEEDFTDFINNHALFYVKQTDTYKNILSKVKEAEHRLNLDVATAMENWLAQQDNQNEKMIVLGNGKSYSANELIEEIRLETEDGQKIEENLLQLTIDLLFRKKEQI